MVRFFFGFPLTPPQQVANKCFWIPFEATPKRMPTKKDPPKMCPLGRPGPLNPPQRHVSFLSPFFRHPATFGFNFFELPQPPDFCGLPFFRRHQNGPPTKARDASRVLLLHGLQALEAAQRQPHHARAEGPGHLLLRRFGATCGGAFVLGARLG